MRLPAIHLCDDGHLSEEINGVTPGAESTGIVGKSYPYKDLDNTFSLLLSKNGFDILIERVLLI